MVQMETEQTLSIIITYMLQRYVASTQFQLKAWIRSDPKGTSSIKHDHYPLKYKAPEYASGHWTRPHFRCDGKVDAWVITYAVPFFGLDSTQKTTKFK